MAELNLSCSVFVRQRKQIWERCFFFFIGVIEIGAKCIQYYLGD